MKSETSRDHLNKTITVGFLFVVVFTALAHGTVEAWSVLAFELMIVVLMLLWLIKATWDGGLNLRVPSIALPMAGLVAVGIVQSIAFADGTGRWRSLSMNVEYTRAAVTVLIFLLVSLVIATNLF